ncbi:hypothetical protein Dimus_024523 [Dionaea muscipula]
MKKTMKSLHWFFMEATIYYAAHLLTIKSLSLSQVWFMHEKLHHRLPCQLLFNKATKLPDSRLPCHNRFIQESKESLHVSRFSKGSKLLTDEKLTNGGTTKPCASSFTSDSPRLSWRSQPTADHRHMKKKKKKLLQQISNHPSAANHQRLV